jgi:hypothetical protein
MRRALSNAVCATLLIASLCAVPCSAHELVDRLDAYVLHVSPDAAPEHRTSSANSALYDAYAGRYELASGMLINRRDASGIRDRFLR